MPEITEQLEPDNLPEVKTSRSRSAFVNDEYVQVSKIYIDEMNQLAQTSQSAHRVLWTLIKEMDTHNAVMISHDSLSKLTKLSEATIKRAIVLLRAERWLEVLKIGTANVYRVNSKLVWRPRDEGQWMAIDARIVMNLAEQDDFTRNALPNSHTRHIPFVEVDDGVADYIPVQNTKKQLER